MFASGKSGTKLVDMGDVADNHFTKTDFTTDATWHTLSFAGIIPAKAKFVHFKLSLQSASPGSYLAFKMKGNSHSANGSTQVQQVGNILQVKEHDLWLNADLEAEYYATNISWTTINIVVMFYGF